MRVLVGRDPNLSNPIRYVVPQGGEGTLLYVHLNVTTGLAVDSPVLRVTNRNGQIIMCVAPGDAIAATTTATVAYGVTGTYFRSVALSSFFVPWAPMPIEEGDFIDVLLLSTTGLNGGVKLSIL